jgi:hypothetical protein
LSCNDNRIELIDIKTKEITFTISNLPSDYNLIIPAVKQKSIYILNDWISDKNSLMRLDIDIDPISKIFRNSSINFDLKEQKYDILDYLKNDKISYF